MSHYGSGVEYGLHCLLHLVGRAEGEAPSSRDLAEFQGLSPSYVAKLFTKLEKAGLVTSIEGIGGGFRLARPADAITVLDVVDAVEGDKPLFRCREVRDDCVLHGGAPPDRGPGEVCSIHAVMLDAESRMRDALAGRTLADLDAEVATKVSDGFIRRTTAWFDDRNVSRRARAGRPKRDKGTSP
jgi:Rrf2 family protein